ncbi:MAG: DNA-binding NarL/FixJ family response regulator [Glaciecola sp.]|jgi:DNA-binding NarL/FixJ family response regulator
MSTPSPIRLLLCEDDVLVREGARSVLDRQEGISVIGVAAHGGELLKLLEHVIPDVVVLDIRMPPTFTTEGIDLAVQLREQHPKLGIVMLSQHADPEYALELLGEGASSMAYLLKERLGDVEQLAQAVQEVANGGSVLDPEIVDGLLRARAGRQDSRLNQLTQREREVLGEMATGKRNAVIARSLSVSVRAVEKHANSIFAKLGLTAAEDLNKRVAAVLLFLQRG